VKEFHVSRLAKIDVEISHEDEGSAGSGGIEFMDSYQGGHGVRETEGVCLNLAIY